jgi:hypothetical protein
MKPALVWQLLEQRFASDQAPQQSAAKIASDLKALRFECKLNLTSTDCMRAVAVPAFAVLKDSAQAPDASPWTDADLHRALQLHSGYIPSSSAFIQVHFLWLQSAESAVRHLLHIQLSQLVGPHRNRFFTMHTCSQTAYIHAPTAAGDGPVRGRAGLGRLRPGRRSRPAGRPRPGLRLQVCVRRSVRCMETQ